MVGMTRAHLADPHLVAKVARGEEHRIRPCVGATYCLDRIYEGQDAVCIHNAATGREATMPHVIRRTDGPALRVIVVGAGPAGLEAARVAGERGHDVVVFEAARQPGGQLRLAAKVDRRRELMGIVDWRVAELERLGVILRCNLYAEAEDVLAEAPDVVLVCTGGLPNTAIVAGHEHVVSSWNVLAGDVAPGGRVLVYDDNGQHPGLAAAEFLARHGSAVEIVTPERFFAVDIGGLNHAAYATVFEETGVRLTINKRVRAVTPDGNALRGTLNSDHAAVTETRHVDQVVFEHGTLPLDDLYFALKPHSRNHGAVDHRALVGVWPQTLVRNPDGRFRLFRLGDAVASRNVHAAIYDALRLAVAL
jgi:NADPH-dependent 2,4-dienoyl-CoA reductase/sulfur reductase-like enzyme